MHMNNDKQAIKKDKERRRLSKWNLDNDDFSMEREERKISFRNISNYCNWLEIRAEQTIKKVEVRMKNEAKQRGFKSVDAMVDSDKRRTRKMIIDEICGGDESLYIEAFNS